MWNADISNVRYNADGQQVYNLTKKVKCVGIFETNTHVNNIVIKASAQACLVDECVVAGMQMYCWVPTILTFEASCIWLVGFED